MKLKECSLIQELLPLYAENLLSQETTQYVKEHLTGCKSCTRDWESFTCPLPDPAPMEGLTPARNNDNKFLVKLRRGMTATVLILIISGAGLAYASYTAGKHVGMNHPDYRFAQELGLFTEINQTKSADGINITLEKALFDGTRSVLFLSLSHSSKAIPRANLLDQTGHEYLHKGSRGWQGRYFMLEFEPIGLDTQQVTVSLALEETEEEETEFTFPVDVVKTVQHTKIIYPNLKKELSGLKITLEKSVLGVSESEFKVYFDWPVDGSVAGLGIGRGGAYFPTSVTKVPDTPPPPGMSAPPPGGLMSSYAANYGINYRPGDPPTDRPALYDMTSRQEVDVQGAEYATTQFPCQVEAALKFAPVKQETEQLELLLPPVFLYERVENSPDISLDFGEGNELSLDEKIPFPNGRVIIEKAWLEDNQLHLSYRTESSVRPDTMLPHFELTDADKAKQGRMRFDARDPQTVSFSMFDQGTKEFYVKLDSIGRLLPREKFTLDLQE